MSGTPVSSPSRTPSWTLPLPAGGRRQFLPIDIEANIPADNGSHPRNGLAPGAEAHRPSPLPRIATTTSSFAPEAPQAPLRCNGGQRWQEKLGWRSHTVEVRLETQMQLPRQPRGRWLSAFPVKLTYGDFTGSTLDAARRQHSPSGGRSVQSHAPPRRQP